MIVIYGVTQKPAEVLGNQPISFTYDETLKALTVSGISLQLG